ncbi:MAG: NYN domain-containing protein, partial [Burkholderiales bacterium]
MAKPDDTPSMAVFCDFENVALGVRDAKYEKFDIRKVLERLLLKGSIVVKKAYCDWARYREFKAEMHEASFELIEIPHVRQSGKNSADIRMVVDALDLCYTKSHVDTFVIVSGDSDFSPLVSKLRENAKTVIGVGVKGSTSDLLTANCDEFIFYDDLVREQRRRGAQSAARREGGRENGREGGREAGRENARGDAGREGGRDANRDGGRGNGPRGPGRGGEREGGRDPARVALTVVPTAGAAAAAAFDDEDTPSVGGPWRPFAAERRDGDDARTGELVPAADDADTSGTQAGDTAPAVEASGEGAAPPGRPGRRSRRGRTRAGAADDAAQA